MTDYNPKHAILFHDAFFTPLNVTTTESLKDLLELQQLSPEQPLLLAQPQTAVIALDMKRMGYYHVAQGEFADEPWMVVF